MGASSSAAAAQAAARVVSVNVSPGSFTPPGGGRIGDKHAESTSHLQQAGGSMLVRVPNTSLRTVALSEVAGSIEDPRSLPWAFPGGMPGRLPSGMASPCIAHDWDRPPRSFDEES